MKKGASNQCDFTYRIRDWSGEAPFCDGLSGAYGEGFVHCLESPLATPTNELYWDTKVAASCSWGPHPPQTRSLGTCTAPTYQSRLVACLKLKSVDPEFWNKADTR